MLIIYPTFRAPKDWDKRGWRERTEPVLVIRPDGRELEATAQINTSVRSCSDGSIPIEERMRVTMWLTDRTAEEVPDGSKILVSREVRDAILPSDAVRGRS
jgi:hypothetical protein